ncbi:YraN family protein [Pseudoalteromonas sp. T1lg48]|uniref:YraN family protein n=1 Tax=Pseudoalteromonas sp. T1lg48 TaxID=2077100 RepID=UPI000CF66412|nr:YraN family protein [Pseudoalteromonas sp. T1lg48]
MFWQPKEWRNSRAKGQHYELLAQDYLEKQGLTPVSRNYNCRYGELDLIMKEGLTWVFVEVKFRRKQEFGGVLYALTERKQQRLRRTIAHYVQKHDLAHCILRADYVAIEGQSVPQFHWIKNVL